MNPASSSSSARPQAADSPARHSPATLPSVGRPAEARGRRRPRSRRPALAVAALLTVGLGLGLRFLAEGAWTGPAGDGLYAVLIYLLLAWCAPQRAPWAVACLAAGLCWLIELFQLTGVPLVLAEAWWPARLVLGTGFAGIDLLAYAAGCAAAGTIDALLLRWRRPMTS